MLSRHKKRPINVLGRFVSATALGLLLVLTLQGSPQAAGQTKAVEAQRCIEPKDRYEATYGTALEPSRPFYVDVGPYRYAVPWKYLHGRPPKVMASCKLKALGVQFWIPDGRAPERDLFWRPEFNPPEKHRPKPGPEDWVIKVTVIKHYETDPPIDVNADRRIANILETHKTLKKSGDLIAVKAAGPDSENYALFKRSSEQSLLFHCLGGNGSRQVCQGFLDLKEKHLAVHFLAPGESVPLNDGIVKTLKYLLQSWEIHR
jgi:hypothetical protein